MRPLKSLVLPPSDPPGRRIQDTVTRALGELGISVLRVDDLEPGAILANAIADAIRSSDFVVADLSRGNPNVLYEVGFANALRKPTFILMSSDATAQLPSDLLGSQYIVYDPDNLRSLSTDLRRATRSLLERGTGDA